MHSPRYPPSSYPSWTPLHVIPTPAPILCHARPTFRITRPELRSTTLARVFNSLGVIQGGQVLHPKSTRRRQFLCLRFPFHFLCTLSGADLFLPFYPQPPLGFLICDIILHHRLIVQTFLFYFSIIVSTNCMYHHVYIPLDSLCTIQ